MMTIQASRFTPEVLLSAPRRSTGVPNSTGELALYTVSSYSFETHSKTSQIRALNIKDGSSHLVSEDSAASEPIWISETEVIFIKSGDNGSSMLLSQDVHDKSSAPHMIHYFAGSISNPKVKALSSDKIAFICSALTTPEGDMYWPAAETKSLSSAKIYTGLFVRHWDAWNTANQNSLWYGLIVKRDGKWTLENPGLTNLLAGTQLSCPVAPFGGTGDFDISTSGIAFVSKDPKLNPARHTKTDLYYVPIKSWTEKSSMPQQVKTGRLRGYSLSPAFSNDGKQVVFARMKSEQYESDKPRLLLLPDVTDLSNVQEFYDTRDGEGGWDLRPDWAVWGKDDQVLYVAAEKHGRMVLWEIPAKPSEATKSPKAIHEHGSVVEARLLGESDSLLISSKSRIESSSYSVLNPGDGSIKEISTSSKHGKSFGLSKSQCSEIWYLGSAGYKNHALVMTPSNFDSSKKYPLAFLIHGGPQSAWTDDWSTRWNPAIFAEQGYVVVCPNPIGSTGYGQAHTDAITENWGGGPYQDLVKCFEYLENEVEYVDTDRAVALGASYGGYMINWIQGNDLGRRFKALVCHDGVFSTQNQWATEELFFPEHDFGGTLWENRAGYAKWDPSLHTGEWATPQLVIHNELDYRLPISEGLAMFNVLQARKVPSKFLMFPDENHWVLKPENSLVWHREVLDWINKYSGVSDEAKLESRTGKLTV
ncbi:Alpha/Beta hydrolase protein [Dactylonectria estremocensis]|uniref:Dipeptidyl-peptidase V n=1 Tax=Dactylonectria estremocensis TaxID=1079267 RepID=A0A9P9JLP4_9HYPO|nr:Alpha/Beta hydrolase protein [Dactylonectria estremocensis]